MRRVFTSGTYFELVGQQSTPSFSETRSTNEFAGGVAMNLMCGNCLESDTYEGLLLPSD
jgi:hypothetical protein